jgi:hypothetical protein
MMQAAEKRRALIVPPGTAELMVWRNADETAGKGHQGS